MNPTLETLMLAFSADDGLTIPSRAIFLGAQPHPALASWPEIIGWQPIKSHADAWDRAGLPRAATVAADQWPAVLVLPGKSRDETLAWFAMGRRCLAPGGTLIAAMPNTAGATRFEKELARAAGGVISIQKNKSRAFYAADGGHWDESLFSEWAALGMPRQIPNTAFITQAGIFSSDHIDPGSLLLASYLPAYLHGHVADLGAGWGYLTDVTLRKNLNISQIDLYESDARALDCARSNLSAHNREIQYHWHDVTTGLLGTYDAIVMNPPFHTGQSTDVGLGRAFLTTAASALKRGGRLFLVANRQLPYESILELSGLSWRKLAEDKIYKILIAEKR